MPGRSLDDLVLKPPDARIERLQDVIGRNGQPGPRR
jgi:hypothetical protein